MPASAQDSSDDFWGTTRDSAEPAGPVEQIVVEDFPLASGLLETSFSFRGTFQFSQEPPSFLFRAIPDPDDPVAFQDPVESGSTSMLPFETPQIAGRTSDQDERRGQSFVVNASLEFAEGAAVGEHVQQMSGEDRLRFLTPRLTRVAQQDSVASGTAVDSPVVSDEPKAQETSAPIVKSVDEVAVVTVPTADEILLEAIASQKTATSQLPDLSDELKATLAKHFQQATDQVGQKMEADRRIKEQKADKENAPAEIVQLKDALAQPPQKTEPDYPETASVMELDQLRMADDAKLTEATKNLDAWEAKAKIRAERKPQMPTIIESARKRLEDAEEILAAAAPEGEPMVLTQARRLDQESLVQLLRSQLELFRLEQSRYEALNELFPLQRDELTRAKNVAEKRMEAWKNILAEARRRESAEQAREAREKLRSTDPTLRELAEENSLLTLRRKELQEFIATKVSELSRVTATLTDLETQFGNIKEKEGRAGLTTVIGLQLRNQRNYLPSQSDFIRRQELAEAALVRMLTEQMELEDDRKMLGDIQSQADATLSSLNVDLEEASSEETNPAEESSKKKLTSTDLREMTVELLSNRRQYLDNLIADYNSCLQTLGETDIACRRLVKVIEDYENYIDERVLWIRSAAVVDKSLPANTWIAAKGFIENKEWVGLWQFLEKDVRTLWLEYAAGGVLIAALFVFSRRARKYCSKLVAEAARQMDSGIPLVLTAIGITVVMASAWPLVLAFCGWRIGRSSLDLAQTLQGGLYFCAAALWFVNSFRKICRKQGVAEAYLQWPQSIVSSLHSNLMIYIAAGLPLSFVVVAAERFREGNDADTIGRMAFVSFCLVLCWILRRIIRPTGPVIGALLRSRPDSWMSRTQWIWYPMAIGSPIALAILAWVGFQYTAEELMIRLQLTLGLSIALSIAYTMLMQWMLAARRQLALKQARARRAAVLAAEKRDSDDEKSVTESLPPIEIPEVDLSLLNQQMVRLIRGAGGLVFLTVSWAIWGQVLPALQVFSRVELWTVVVETMEVIPNVTEGDGIRAVSRVEQVTLGHLLLALVVLSTSVLASRNLPGLLELSVLQRLPLDHGGRHAVTTVCRYLLLFTGVVVACNTIGVGWGNVQWLVAALTVGLGFGLQEIFANFVSGLIILFERPIRIGDVVTIDGVSGAVSRIQIRATTITDWDRKEFIVPNKEFVTGKLLNWTLSDKTNRIVINVGVAYGTDTDFAMALLQEAAESQPLLLKDPPPSVSFEGFGDSTLNLVLRCFLPNLDNRLKVMTQLHTAINERFRAANIEIAFPQRDVHIRSVPAGFGSNPPGTNKGGGNAAGPASPDST